MRRVLRILAIALWTFGAMWVWPALLLLGLRELVHRHITISWLRSAPPWLDAFVFYGLFGVVTVLITAVVLIQGVRGRLPGTAKSRRELSRGFPIEASRPGE